MANYSVGSILNKVVEDIETNPKLKIAGTITSTPLVIIASYSGDVTVDYTINGQGIFISNDGNETITVTIGTIVFEVRESENFEGIFAPFSEIGIVIPATCNYRLLVLN